MFNGLKYIVASAGLLCAQTVNATTYAPAGTYVFSGQVIYQKDMSAFGCTMELTIDATSSAATATARIYDKPGCASFIDGNGTVSFDGTHLTVNGWTMQFVLSTGYCTGPVKMQWGGNGTAPRTIGLSSPMSDSTATAGAPCKFMGTLTQTSGPGALTITNP
ncbi:hypothetical protein [Pseudonocardia sp. TMWB2A]|uniref:hypothetical protein n=1 Tax=Pseudonocardia sp. TMWB2A TaxID=687430 RepID=UPI00307E5E71